MFSTKAKPMPTMPAYTSPSSTPSSSARRHHSSRMRKAPLVASSVTGATTARLVSSLTPTKRPPTPCTRIATAVATKPPHNRPAASRRRGSGS